MRELLIICAHFPPSAASGAFRMLGFARHLPSFGWATNVVACTQMPHEPVDDSLQENLRITGEVHRVDYPQGRWARIKRRLLARTRILDVHSTWCDAALGTCRQLIASRRPDAILTSGPPHSVHLLGRRLKREFGVPLVTDFRDPWVASRRALRGVDRVRRRIEHAVLRASDRIVANAPQARGLIESEYPDCGAKIDVVPNGFDSVPAVVPHHCPAPSTAAEINILHAGELYAGRDPGPLLDAIAGAEKQASNLGGWRLRFLGRTDGCGLDLVAESRRRMLRCQVLLEGQVAYATAKRDMAQADILLLLDGPGRRVGVPAKVYEYMGAGRPILALAEPDGDTAWALQSSGVTHRLARPKDVPAIQQALVELTHELRSGNLDRKPSACGQFTREETARKLSSVLELAVLNARPCVRPLASDLAGATACNNVLMRGKS